jgi:carbamoyl-phosphate synthase large subunit
MRVLVIGAGGPAGVNTCRALWAAGHDVYAQDRNKNHLIWAEPYLAKEMAEPEVVMIAPDNQVLRWVTHEHPYAAFLPKPQTVLLCQDKFECGLQWRRDGLREDRTTLIDFELDDLTSFDFSRFEFPLWLRARHGAGAKAAICATTNSEAASWYSFWKQRDPSLEFVTEGYLPGRDYSWCGIYRDGELLVSFARERLEYLYPHLTPEGLTGTPTRAQIVHNADVDEMAEAAVSSVDADPHGIFCVDLREDETGQPRPTEINAGRFSTTVGLWSLFSIRSNFVALAAELAVGDDWRLELWDPLPEGLILSRHIDCGHQFTMAKVPA